MARYDVLILGGGAAGCVLAGRLLRWPADILDARWLALAERAADWI